MTTALSVLLGLGLASACGFRVFVPLLVMGLAARGGHLELGSGFDWMASTPALVAFGVATALEVLAYHVPWLDHLLDTVASPAAVVAGVIVTASVVTGLDPFLKWTLAVIAGGGIAGAVQAMTVGGRAASLVSTAGLGNPLVASAEGGASLLVSVLSVISPVIALAVVATLVLLFVRWRRRRREAAA